MTASDRQISATEDVLQEAISRLENKQKKQSDVYPEVAIIRSVLAELLGRVEVQIVNPEAHSPEEIALWWGKDSVLSVLTKVTQILSKTIPLEQSLEKQEGQAVEGLSAEDQAILERYIKRCIDAKRVL